MENSAKEIDVKARLEKAAATLAKLGKIAMKELPEFSYQKSIPVSFWC